MKDLFHEVCVIKGETVVFMAETAFFDASGGANLLKALDELAPDRQSRCVTIELCQVRVLTSQLLNLMIEIAKSSKRVRLCGLRRDANDVLVLTRTLKFFQVFPSLDVALDAA
jgi:anti-anti-sigma regulatory factor